MNAAWLSRWALASLAALLLLSIATAAAAANTVPPTRIGRTDTAVSLAQLAPPECAGMLLTVLRVGGGPGGGNALVLGSAAGQTLSGGGGDDCIVGGAGGDTLRGQGGNDVLIGGGGFFEVLNGGGGNDTCYAGGSVLVLPVGCETYVP